MKMQGRSGASGEKAVILREGPGGIASYCTAQGEATCSDHVAATSLDLAHEGLLSLDPVQAGPSLSGQRLVSKAPETVFIQMFPSPQSQPVAPPSLSLLTLETRSPGFRCGRTAVQDAFIFEGQRIRP